MAPLGTRGADLSVVLMQPFQSGLVGMVVVAMAPTLTS